MDNKEDKDQRKKEIMKTICDLIPEWKSLNLDLVKTDRLSGITNETYKVSHPNLQ